jgi:hypothetical protein
MQAVIIGGKLYDPATAREVSHVDAPEGRGAVRITLFKTTRGNYFTVKNGSPLKGYRRSRGIDQEVLALTAEEAKAWMECFASVDAYVAEFGAPEVA